MDMIIVFSLHKFSLLATIDHHVPLYILVIILPLLTVTFYCNDSDVTESEMIDNKNTPTAYVAIYQLII